MKIKNLLTKLQSALGLNAFASLDYGIKNSNSYVYDHNQSKLTSICLYDFTREIINSGAGEIHLCSIDKDGTSLGLDVKTAKKLMMI